MTYYSEYGEDRFLDEAGLIPPTGTYIDVGAAWPQLRSNTAFLRDRGWTGLAIDANPFYLGMWGHDGFPPLINAIIHPDPTVLFEFHPNPDLSGINPKGIPCPAMTLDELCDKHGINNIDFLSLDCEGGEFDALSTLDLRKRRPAIIVSEYATIGKPNDYRVKEYLKGWGYQEIHRTTANLIFK